MKNKDKKKNPAPQPTATPQAAQPPQSPSKPFLDRAQENGLLFLLGLAPLLFMRMGGEFDNNPKMAFLQWGIALMALVQVLRIQKNGRFVWNRTPLDIPVLAFYGFCLLAQFQAVNPYQGVLYILHLGAAVIFFFFVTNLSASSNTIRHFFFITAAGSCCISVIGIMQKLYGITWIPQLTDHASTFSNKNMAAQFLAIAFPLSLGAIITSRQIWLKIISGIFFAVTCLFLVYTETRACWLAATAVVVLLAAYGAVLLYKRGIRDYINKEIIIAICCCVVTVTVLFSSPQIRQKLNLNTDKISEQYLSIGSGLGGSSMLRSIWWYNTAIMIKDNFWQGVGLGNFKLHYPRYHQRVGDSKLKILKGIKRDWSFGETKQLNRVHNDYLQIFVETGIFGFCAWLLIFILALYLFWKTQWTLNNEKRLQALFLFLGILAFMIEAVFTFPLERAIPPIYLFVLLGFLALLYSEKFPRPLTVSRRPTQAGIRIGLAAALLLYAGCSFNYIKKIVTVDKYFVEALMFSDRGDTDNAGAALQKASIFSMWNFNVPALLARNHTIKNDYQNAIAAYEETFRAHPNHTNALLNIGYCYLQIKQFDKAIAYFKKYLEVIPYAAKGHNNLAIAYFSKKDYDNAIIHYKKSSELDPSYAEPHFNLGNTYRTLERASEALREYEKALQLNPGMDQLREYLANIYTQTGLQEKAAAVMAPLLQKRQAAIENHMQQGTRFQQQGRHQECLDQYLKAMQLSTPNPFIFYNVALAYYYLQKFTQAEEFLTKSFELARDIAETYNLLGQLLIRKGDEQGARDNFSKALELKPQFKEAQINLATFYLRSGALDEAIVAYQKTLALDPAFALAHYNLGTIFMHKKQKQKALYHFEQSLKNPPQVINVAATQGIINKLRGEITQEKLLGE
ncbi:MAG: tetratricopeptide repeat protein [Deltaproteobacteria bacterium]|nr:tetratricopeptide repeat protein [Deltaproteobacteria bacterium]